MSRISAGTLSVTTYPTRAGLRLAVAGEVDIATVERLTAALEHALDQQPTSLLVDLAEVTFMASAGVSSLMAGYRRACSAAIPLTVTNCGRAVERVLEITGVYKLLTGLEPFHRR